MTFSIWHSGQNSGQFWGQNSGRQKFCWIATLAHVGDDGLEELRAAVRLAAERAPEKHLTDRELFKVSFRVLHFAIRLPHHKSGWGLPSRREACSQKCPNPPRLRCRPRASSRRISVRKFVFPASFSYLYLSSFIFNGEGKLPLKSNWVTVFSTHGYLLTDSTGAKVQKWQSYFFPNPSGGLSRHWQCYGDLTTATLLMNS